MMDESPHSPETPKKEVILPLRQMIRNNVDEDGSRIAVDMYLAMMRYCERTAIPLLKKATSGDLAHFIEDKCDVTFFGGM